VAGWTSVRQTPLMPQPSGTVTLLFSDVEGSTRLWEAWPESMAAAIERHDHIIRDAVASEGGYVFKTMGDEFCVAFSTGRAAVAAALGAQRALASESWPEGAGLRVRMALHSGTCQERDGDYFGPAVNRAARLMAIGHGGQVLVSGSTAELLGDAGVAGLSLRDLGLHRLRDLGRPEHVFQLVAPGIAADFAPLRSLDNPELPNNLPALLSGFVGRERELADVHALVREGRLVTLTGAGGSGKTRLAMQAAAELLDGSGDGVWLVELAPVAEEDKVAAAVATAIGITEGMDAAPVETLVRALSPQSALVILDNCEHLVDRVAKLVDAILRGCPKVHVVATSREPLGVDGERVYRVPSMSLPDDDVETLEEAEGSDAVALFASRAADAGATVPEHEAALVATVCRRLDGIPLALELAAARLSSMSLQQLSDRLDQRFRLLTGGSRNAMARQQTLQALVDWSYGLLNPSEQSVLRRLSVFVGGFELDAAESICQGPEVDEFDVLNLLHSLVEKSLVVADQDAGSVRYRLLETIRQYGSQELLKSTGEEGVLEARDRHAAYFLALADEATEALRDRRQFEWYARLDLEADNVRAAMSHLSGDPSRARDVLALAVSLQQYFRSRGQVEVIPQLLGALSATDDEPDELVARGWLTAGTLLGWLYTPDREKVALAARCAERASALGARLGLVDVEALALGMLALTSIYNRDREGAVALADRALAVVAASDDERVRCEVELRALGNWLPEARGLSFEERREKVNRVKAVAERHGDAFGVAVAEFHLAGYDLHEGNLRSAKDHYQRGIPDLEASGALEGLTSPRQNLMLTMFELGEDEEAVPLLRTCLRAARRAGFRHEIGDLVFAAGCVAARRGDAVSAVRLISSSQVLNADGYEKGTLYRTDSEVRMEEECLAMARAALGDDAFEREAGVGRLLGVPESCELALSAATVVVGTAVQ